MSLEVTAIKLKHKAANKQLSNKRSTLLYK